jgi:hypothetical protein
VPNYAGAPVLIATTAKGFDGEVLTDVDVNGLQVSIYDSTGALVHGPVAMTWNDAKQRWQYEWDTTDFTYGTYKAEVDLIANDNLPTPEFIRIRLAKRPVSPPVG